mgnify:CR=1 FL=1
MRRQAHGQQSFTDLTLVELGGPPTSATHPRLEAVVPWEQLVQPIRMLPEYARYVADPTRPGQGPMGPMIMIKAMMLQKWFGLSDPHAEEELKDRISFRRFVGLSITTTAVTILLRRHAPRSHRDAMLCKI